MHEVLATCGPDHPDVATELGNLGLVLEDAGDLGGARVAHERALAIQTSAFGDCHPNVAIALANLASLLRKQGEPERAREALERADRIFQRHRQAKRGETPPREG